MPAIIGAACLADTQDHDVVDRPPIYRIEHLDGIVPAFQQRLADNFILGMAVNADTAPEP